MSDAVSKRIRRSMAHLLFSLGSARAVSISNVLVASDLRESASQTRQWVLANSPTGRDGRAPHLAKRGPTCSSTGRTAILAEIALELDSHTPYFKMNNPVDISSTASYIDCRAYSKFYLHP